MNNLIFWLYMANIADSVKNTFEALSVAIIFVFVAMGVIYMASEFSDIIKPIFYNYMKIAIIPLILFGALSILLPTSKFLYMVIGLKTAEIGIENMQGLEEFNKARKILNLKLDELLEENKQKIKKE